MYYVRESAGTKLLRYNRTGLSMILITYSGRKKDDFNVCMCVDISIWRVCMCIKYHHESTLAFDNEVWCN